MRRFAALFLLGSTLLALPVARADDGKWEKFGSEDGIDVFRRSDETSDVIALRGQGVINAPVARVLSILVDTPRDHEWIDSLVEARVIRRISETEYVKWDHIKTPVPLTDRDFVFRAKLTIDEKSKKVFIKFHSVIDDKAPKTDYVRGEFKYGAYTLTPLEGGKKTHLDAQILADPKGAVPKFLVNLFQKDWPLKTLRALRVQAAKKDIKDNEKVKKALVDAGIAAP